MNAKDTHLTTKRKNGISIIIPFLNEEDGIEICCKTLDQYAGGQDFLVELIFVDDGSTDSSAAILENYAFQYVDRVKAIRLSKNFGSHSAIRAGIREASYDRCTWIGSDLQEPLELIRISMEKLNSGYDAVYVEKKSINVGIFNRFFSKTYSWMMRKYAVSSYSSGGISTIVFNRKIMDYLNANVESNSSIMLQIMDSGFRYVTISLDFKARAQGKSKWTLSKKIKLLIDSFVSFSFMPIRLVSMIGVLIFLLGLIIGIVTIINKIVNPAAPAGYSSLASIMALGFGITNISLGIIAEYLWRTYDAARKRPPYIVSDVKTLKMESDKTDK